jgi:hypothetical protein
MIDYTFSRKVGGQAVLFLALWINPGTFAAENNVLVKLDEVQPSTRALCATVLGGVILQSVTPDPRILVIPNVGEVTVSVPGFGGDLAQTVNISGLHVFNPSLSLHLGPMTYYEASYIVGHLNCDGDGWRLPTVAELLALQQNGIWKIEGAFRLNTVWADTPEADLENRTRIVAEREGRTRGPHLARQIAADMLRDQEFEHRFGRFAVNLITGQKTFVSPRGGALNNTKFPSLFVRDQR